MTLARRVGALSDFEAVAACADFAAALAERRGLALLDDVDALSEIVGEIDTETLKANLDEHYHVGLPPDVSVELARAILAAAAADPQLAPMLEKQLEETRDTKQFALEVLAVGAAISMVIVAATTKRDRDGWAKETLSPDLAEKLGGWLDKLRPWLATGQAA